MAIYISSRELKIDLDIEVKLLNRFSFDLVREDDIIIGTGTVRDDLMVRVLIDREVLPFIVTFSDMPISSLLENLSLIINKKIDKVTSSVVEEIIRIKKSIESFENHSKSFFKQAEDIKTLALYQQFLVFEYFYNKSGFKSVEKVKESRRDIYISNSHRGKSLFVILHNDNSLRVFEIKGKVDENEREFIYNIFNRYFEAFMDGEKVKIRKRRYSFEYREITQKYKEEYLLIGIDNEYNFSDYTLYNINSPKLVKNIGVYQTDSNITTIDEKGKLALSSLRGIIKNSTQNPMELYKNLDIFLYSARNFKSIISFIDYKEQNSFKQTVISDIFEKIFDNIKKDNRKISLFRFALVSLLSDEFEEFNLNIISYIFYDIHNGININAKLLKEATTDKIAQKKTLDENYIIDKSNDEIFDAFLDKKQSRKFIKTLLHTIFNMSSENILDREKSIKFILFTTYIATEDNPKITKRNGIEKIQIEHCFMTTILYLIELNINELFFLIEEFFEIQDDTIDIKNVIENEYTYSCVKEDKRIKIRNIEVVFEKTEESLRQINKRFLAQLLIIGKFYKLLSKELFINDIIETSFYKIKNRDINESKLCKDIITLKFLKLFFKKNMKRDCIANLKSFFKAKILILIG